MIRYNSSMNIKIVTLTALLVMIFSFGSQVHASETCEYSSTQARVQPTTADPWQSHYTLMCNQKFNVGSFHDNTGQFATDTKIKVTAPNGASKIFSNGGTVTPVQNGTYTISVRTPGQEGLSCQDQATVTVTCKPNANTCSHASTQARVQNNVSTPWRSNITTDCLQSFNVGSFHNGIDTFATDTKLKVIGKIRIPFLGEHKITREYANGNTVYPIFPGRYTLKVTTQDESGAACEDTAVASVSCDFMSERMQGWKFVW